MQDMYEHKYIKYKNKYLELKTELIGGNDVNILIDGYITEYNKKKDMKEISEKIPTIPSQISSKINSKSG